MSSLSTGTMLAYLAGAAAFVCVVMAVYWGMQRVPAGFGLWTASSALVGAACVLVADQGHVPEFVRTLVVPGVITLAALLRGQGLGRFLGRKGLGRSWLVLPLIVVGLLAILRFAWDYSSARVMVIAAAVALVSWMAARAVLAGSGEGRRWFLRFLGVVLLIYGALWFGYGVHWMVGETGFPLEGVGLSATIFLAAITAFEIFWVVFCLLLSVWWNAEALDVARREAEKELRALAEIVTFLPDATFALSKDRRVVAWNRGAEEITGIPAEKVIGACWSETGAGAALGEEITLSEALLDPSTSLPLRYRNVQLAGDSISAEEEGSQPGFPDKLTHVWRTATLLRDTGGEVKGTIECLRDVTWRVESERAVRENEERYRSLFENSLDGILVIAPGGTIIDANVAACRMLDMTQDELGQIDPGSLIKGSAIARETSSTNPSFGTALQELTLARRDGSSFPAEAMSVVWNDVSGRLRAFIQFRDISERVESQRVIRDSEARLLEVQAASRVGNWEIDLVSRSIWISPETMRIYGIEQDSPYFPLEQNHLADLTEDPGKLQEALEEVMSGGGSYDIEYRIRRADDGAMRVIRSIGEAILGRDDQPVRVVGVVRDVTELERTDTASELLHYPIDHSGEQVFWVDSRGGIMSVSDSACEELGYTRDELLGMTIYDVNPTLDPDSAEPWEALKAEGIRRFETIHRTKVGRDIAVEVTVQQVVQEGEEYRFVFVRDISERKRLEETLRRTQLSLDQGSQELYWLDPEGHFAFITDSTCASLGYSREELLAMSIFDVDPTVSTDWGPDWERLVREGTLSRRGIHRKKDGTEVLVETVASFAEYEGKNYAVVFAQTIDHTTAVIEQPSKNERELLQSENLEAVGQLAGGIAHDLNNLLTAIIGYGNLILTSEEAQGLRSLRKDAEEIKEAAERAAALTGQILAFARRQPLRPQVVNLADLVSGLEERMLPLLGDKTEVAISRPDAVGLVEVDKGQLEEVVLNLVRNACEAMPSGGRLTLEVKNAELSEEYCRAYPELRPGAYVMLACSDTGVGMDPDTRLRIFEPFFTTKPPGEGTGLGLSMVYGTVRQSGGHILAYSEVGKGTTLKVYLPRVIEPVDAAEPAEPVSLQEAGNETILVVEDEPPLRRLVSRVLGDLGYRVFVAGDGPEALELLEDMESAPDLLVTDVILPGGLQGNELAEKFNTVVPDLLVLYMSGHPRDAIVHAGRLDQGVFFLGKPFAPQDLVAKVQEVLGSVRNG